MYLDKRIILFPTPPATHLLLLLLQQPSKSYSRCPSRLSLGWGSVCIGLIWPGIKAPWSCEGMTQIRASRRLSGRPPTTAFRHWRFWYSDHISHSLTGLLRRMLTPDTLIVPTFGSFGLIFCLEAETTLQSFTNAITTSNGSNMTYLHLLLLYLHSIRILDWKISFMSLVTICVTAIWTHTYRVETKSFTIWNMTMHCNVVALKFKQSQLLLALIS